MPRHRDDSLDEDDEDNDFADDAIVDRDDDASDEDIHEDMGDDTEPCPHCKAPIYADGEWCPKCGKYLTKEEPGASRQKTWIVAVCVVLLMVMLLMAAFGR